MFITDRKCFMINSMKKQIVICLIFVCTFLMFPLTAERLERTDIKDIAFVEYATNKDNSLVLFNTSSQPFWYSTVYAVNPVDVLNPNFSMYKLWAESECPSTIKSLVYSPYSDDFYFVACFTTEDEDDRIITGLFTVKTDATTKASELSAGRYALPMGCGYILVNKTGLWLLKDIPSFEASAKYPWTGSLLYQLEDTKGHFLMDVPETANDITAISFWRSDNIPGEADRTQNSLRDMVFQTTDYSLLLRDQDSVSWWNFDCVKQTAIKYASFDEARAAGIALEAKYSRKAYWEERHFTLFIVLASVVFILIAALMIQLLLSRKRTVKAAVNSVKERNRMTFEIQEKERAKISRDIHDSVVQDIRVIRLETENLVVDEASKERQSKIEDIATDCIVKLRNICYNLTPAELTIQSRNGSSEFELISIINSLVQQFSSRTHFPCVFKVAEGFEYPVLDKEATQNLFRVIQEALTNIEKHSYATQASIFIKEEDGVLQIYITDDGIGCNQDELKKKIAKKEHLGLRSMMDRMELIGGTIEFFTAQDDGMEIKISLPLGKTGE